MRKLITILLITLSVNASAQGRKIYFHGGDTSFYNLAAGDTVFFDNANGNLGEINSYGCVGDSLNKFVFINNPAYASRVLMRGLYSRFYFFNCEHFEVSGAGRPEYTYGFDIAHMSGPIPTWSGWQGYFFFHIGGKSKNFNIHNLELHHGQMGAVMKEDATYDSTYSAQSGYVYDSITFHDCYIHHVFNEGTYIGNTTNVPNSYFGGYLYNDTHRPYQCLSCAHIAVAGARFSTVDTTIRVQGNYLSKLPAGATFYVGDANLNNVDKQGWYVKSSSFSADTTIIHADNRDLWHDGVMYNEKDTITIDSVRYLDPMPIGKLHIYNMIIDSTGRGNIQVTQGNSSAWEIDHNWLHAPGLTRVGGQGNNMNIGTRGIPYIHDNQLLGSPAESMNIIGSGRTNMPVRIENNYIDSSGYSDAYTDVSANNFAWFGVASDAGNNWVPGIAIRTQYKGTTADSMQFIIKNNRFGIYTFLRQTTWDGKKYAPILIADNEESVQVRGSIICGNTNLAGTKRVFNGIDTIISQQHEAGKRDAYYDTTGCTNANPISSAGTDQSVSTSSCTLNGSSSYDTDGSISSYSWSKITGGSASITSPSTAITTVTGLASGTYVFRLTVTDNLGASAWDDVQVTVSYGGISGNQYNYLRLKRGARVKIRN